MSCLLKNKIYSDITLLESSKNAPFSGDKSLSIFFASCTVETISFFLQSNSAIIILFPKEWQLPSTILDMNNMNIIDSYSSNSYLSINTDGSSVLKDYAVFIGRNGFKTTDSALEKIKYIFD